MLSEGLATMWPDADHAFGKALRGRTRKEPPGFDDNAARFYREDEKAAILEPGLTRTEAVPIHASQPCCDGDDGDEEENGCVAAHDVEVIVRLRFLVEGARDAEHGRIAAIARVHDFGEVHGFHTELLTIELSPEASPERWRQERPGLRTA